MNETAKPCYPFRHEEGNQVEHPEKVGGMGDNVLAGSQAVWSGKSVLVVDDYPSIRKSMRELVQGLEIGRASCRERV